MKKNVIPNKKHTAKNIRSLWKDKNRRRGEKRKMQYEDRIREVLKLAKNAKNEGDLDKLCSLEKSLIKACIYRLDDPRKADQILAAALGKGDTGD